jgi:hypothetical protein
LFRFFWNKDPQRPFIFNREQVQGTIPDFESTGSSEFVFQFLSFSAAAKERQQAAPQMVVDKAGESIFESDLVGGNQVRDFGGCCHGLNGLFPQRHYI